MEEQQQNKSTRSFEEWKTALVSLITKKDYKAFEVGKIDDERIRPYYDQGLQPYVCFKELFNK